MSFFAKLFDCVTCKDCIEDGNEIREGNNILSQLDRDAYYKLEYHQDDDGKLVKRDASTTFKQSNRDNENSFY